ncbi:MAG TPA: hypothetical protein PLR08_00835 [bacterium]|nr:hypothetical protein [bacterium]
MSRQLTKCETDDGACVNWSSVDGTFKLVVRYKSHGFVFDVKNGAADIKNKSSSDIKLLPHMRIEDVLLPPWRDEVLVHVTTRPFGVEKIYHHIRLLRFPINKQVVYSASATDIVETRFPQNWLSMVAFCHHDRNFLLPYLNEQRYVVLYENELHANPVHDFKIDIELYSCGYLMDSRWWVCASCSTEKGQQWFVQIEGHSTRYFTFSPGFQGRVQVLDDGRIQVSKLPKGDSWVTVGTF